MTPEMEFVQPMLAITAEAPFDDPEWQYEIKWDGYRCQIHWNGSLHLYSRQGHDMAGWFPDLKDTGTFLRSPVILDAELVAWEAGRPSFSALQRRAPAPHRLIVFDCLYAQKRWLLHEPLRARLAILHEEIESNERVVLSEGVAGQGVRLLEAVREKGLEGVMAKRLQSLYIPGQRVRTWQKFLALTRLWATVSYVSRSETGAGWMWWVASAENPGHFLGRLPAPGSWQPPALPPDARAQAMHLAQPIHVEVSCREITPSGKMRHGRIRRWQM